jgi:hypothetical protein
LLLSALLIGCSNTSSPLPPYTQFTVPAIGTPMPGGKEEQRSINLPDNYGGALFVNRSASTLHIVINNTIVEIQGGHDFLFILSPGSYDFYIYESGLAPRVFPAVIETGKTRYIYLFAQLPG